MIHINGTRKSCVYTLCATHPCHRGTCDTCHCPDGYRGHRCETALPVYHEDVGLSFSSLFAICMCFIALLGEFSAAATQTVGLKPGAQTRGHRARISSVSAAVLGGERPGQRLGLADSSPDWQRLVRGEGAGAVELEESLKLSQALPGRVSS
ncbi:hypothetical protein NHX12_005152 [Muraenolepis orangiensis]|uniref:EGF-like domain-containing protein n=1 Tax=Muraenolepis orangiensis TaxID=630683 RepID=A0A9Q0ICP4_9TELE|nr:hypothetical protein NHX12_005152 [Muraenolepis orangiensis]